MIVVMIMSTTLSYASFPVKRVQVNQTTVNADTETTSILVSPAAASGQKSQGVALLLWLFLGGLAAHRWYLGSPWYWNILFILTAGGLLVWAIVDLIGIITGDYKPKKGEYKNEFW